MSVQPVPFFARRPVGVRECEDEVERVEHGLHAVQSGIELGCQDEPGRYDERAATVATILKWTVQDVSTEQHGGIPD